MSLRIVSLLPSATEIVCSLGLQSSLVGVSHECDFPPDVMGLPVVTRPKIDPERSSREIDADIRSLVSSGLSVYEIETEQLAALAPDLIVTQDQCEVCAVAYSDVVAAVRRLAGANVEIVSLRPSRLEDVFRDVATVAAAAGVAARGRKLAASLRSRVERLGARTASLPKPRIACLEWLDPLMAAGNWVPDLVAAAGGRYDLASAGAHSAWLEWQQLIDSEPEVLCAMPCGFSLARTLTELERLLEEERWRLLPAVATGRVFAVDGSAYFNRPGSRLVDSAEILAGILHPEECGALLPGGSVVQLAPPKDGGALSP